MQEFTRFLPSLLDECRLSSRWPPTLRLSQLTTVHIHIIIITQPISWCHFTIPQTVEGLVDLGTAVKVRSPCPRLYIAAAVVINNHPWCDSNLGPLTLQSDALTTTRPLRRVHWRILILYCMADLNILSPESRFRWSVMAASCVCVISILRAMCLICRYLCRDHGAHMKSALLVVHLLVKWSKFHVLQLMQIYCIVLFSIL